jgi:nucleoside-diphosphate-sugar epimerase
MVNNMKKIFITGGSGYVGNVLVDRLLEQGFFVTSYDSGLYGFGKHEIIKNTNFNLIKGDLRNEYLLEKSVKGHEIVIHLACISNDPSFELKPEVSKSINFDIFEPLVKISKKNLVNKFIYCSTGSVYGFSEAEQVTEEEMLVPMTQYNTYKAKCEPILLNYSDKNFITTIIRPATVCGYSPRMRFDLTVNILTNHAYNNKIIKVFGGEQFRPNIHIIDMCRVYETLINSEDKKINEQIFNTGYKNYKIKDIAQKIAEIFKTDLNLKLEIQTAHNDDKRSYRLNSEKFKKTLDFSFKYDIDFAIRELIQSFKNNLFKKNTIKDLDYFNVEKMKFLLKNNEF